MDILYHAVTGLVISKAITHTFIPEAALFAVLPDLIGLPDQIIATLRLAHQSKHFWKKIISESQITKFYHPIGRISYRASHSLIAWTCVTFCVWIFQPNMTFILSLSYLSHILIDIPTHDGEFAQRPFYPISDWNTKGAFWRTHPKRFISFWVVLTTALFCVIIWK